MALTTKALTTLQALKDELGITDSGEDAKLEALINRYSDRIATYCNREFHYEAARSENFAGYGYTTVDVEKPPLKSITSITYNGDTLDSASYEIHDTNAGTIYRTARWIWPVDSIQEITAIPIPGSERKRYTIVYTAGWVTPQQAIDDATLTRDLPYDIEEACLWACTSKYRNTGRNTAVKSEKLGDWQVTYGSTGGIVQQGFTDLPGEAKGLLAPYRFIPTGAS
jgi:hypothetical protein